MKSLAELKRTICPGTRLRCVDNTYRPELNGKLRTVTRVQTNGFYWTHEGDEREYWTPYAKASLFMFEGSIFSFPIGVQNHCVKLELL